MALAEVLDPPVGVGVLSSFAAVARSTAVPSARVILIALDLVRGTNALADAWRFADGELIWPGVKGCPGWKDAGLAWLWLGVEGPEV